MSVLISYRIRNRASPCPIGAIDNSPAFQRWVNVFEVRTSPVGTAEFRDMPSGMGLAEEYRNEAPKRDSHTDMDPIFVPRAAETKPLRRNKVKSGGAR